MNVHVPTVEEIFRVAFLVHHGWVLNHRKFWEKNGKTRELLHFEQQMNLRDAERGFGPTYFNTDFEFEDAYYAELNAQEAKEGSSA